MWKTFGQDFPEHLRNGSKSMFVVIAKDVQVGNSKYTSDPYCVWLGGKGEFIRWPHSFEPTHYLELPGNF